MTKRELVARLVRDPILIEPVGMVTCYRVALHDDPDPSGGVWIALAPIAGTLLLDEYRHVHARVSGKVIRLTSRETEAVVSRLRRLFEGGCAPMCGIASTS